METKLHCFNILNDGNNNGQLRIATPPRVAHAKPPGPIKVKTKDSNLSTQRWTWGVHNNQFQIVIAVEI